MRVKKIFIILTLFIIIISNITIIFADDEEEEIDINELNEILEASVQTTEEPAINSRYAVVYDRTSRSDNIW